MEKLDKAITSDSDRDDGNIVSSTPDDHIDSAANSSNAVDHLQSLSGPGWSVKAKRGSRGTATQSALPSEIPDDIVGAALGLLKLAHGNKFKNLQIMNKSESEIEIVAEDGDEGSSVKASAASEPVEKEQVISHKKKSPRKVENKSKNLQIMNTSESEIETVAEDVGEGSRVKGSAASESAEEEEVISNKKSPRKAKNESKNLQITNKSESEIETVAGDGYDGSSVEASTASEHRCKVCGRTFSSGPALGGHVRNHK